MPRTFLSPTGRQAVVLLGLPLLLVAATAIPLGFWRGPYQWLCAGTAAALILPVGAVTLWLTDRVGRTSPYGKVTALFMGTALRLMVGFGGAVMIFLLSRPTFTEHAVTFWLWVLGTYLTTLIVETALLAGPRNTAGPSA